MTLPQETVTALRTLDLGLFDVGPGKRRILCPGFLITTNAGRRILFDTGFPPAYATDERAAAAADGLDRFGRLVDFTAAQTAEGALALLGLRVSDQPCDPKPQPYRPCRILAAVPPCRDHSDRHRTRRTCAAVFRRQSPFGMAPSALSHPQTRHANLPRPAPDPNTRPHSGAFISLGDGGRTGRAANRRRHQPRFRTSRGFSRRR